MIVILRQPSCKPGVCPPTLRSTTPYQPRREASGVRVLVIGGTAFLSRAVAEIALARGHEVVCLTRGTSGDPPPGATHVRVDWSVPDPDPQLRGTFDAVIDVARRPYRGVRLLTDRMYDRAGHWTFVSTCLVYRDRSTPGATTDAELIAPDGGGPYAPSKLASEQAVRLRFGTRALIVRPGLIAGWGDPSDRFGYWPERLARGGTVLAPGRPEDLIQWIDVRDLAEWLVESAERRRSGTFDAVGTPVGIGSALGSMAAALDVPSELVWVPQEFLHSAGVVPWSGQDSLPLWVRRPDDAGLMARDPLPTLNNGLRLRALADTARAALAWERALGSHRERKSGLSPARERAVLDLWRAGAR
ncbi:NAD-dependent epimerase/dehydratase family protein [Streptomyces sp. NA02950]|uniref:NAD-dependent epimerase/dehydratase family protein n=1 Tax=Streptomyces sp. NA02950 TaxID=2742137 RepID=UPI001590CCEE|nr:NAD-dependent epimerase/dehydratase family protein [Streptomyces sp. NA02950]QKV94918.1 NAD-dependent epimerase/dehydratase family protein [Streptomyces sp. NA02950]